MTICDKTRWRTLPSSFLTECKRLGRSSLIIDMKTTLQQCQFFPLVWAMVVLTSIQFHFVFCISHQSYAERVLLSSRAQVHDVCGEVLDSLAWECSPQVTSGNRNFRSLLPKWPLAFAVTTLSGSTTLATTSNCPAGITTYRLFVRKFPLPESDDVLHN